MTTDLLRVEHITRQSNDTVLLDDVSLTVHSGDAIGLVGPSGSGKSTLLRAIAMLDPADNGDVYYQDQHVSSVEVPRYRRKVVYLGQRPCMIRGSVLDNLRLPFQLSHSQAIFDRSRIESLLSDLGRPATFLAQDAAKLSGGEQQSVALVRSLLVDPEVLLLDEPTASLDQVSVAVVERFLASWKGADAKRSWIWTSHDPEQIQRMTTRLLPMNSGKLLDA